MGIRGALPEVLFRDGGPSQRNGYSGACWKCFSEDQGDNRVPPYAQGLVVPVLRNVETMNYADIEKNINELGIKVRHACMYRTLPFSFATPYSGATCLNQYLIQTDMLLTDFISLTALVHVRSNVIHAR